MVPEEKIKVRIKFSKTGDLMYISHLDLARTMQRIILRSGIDIWYSEGFNPQPKMVFGVPLPVGVESECELMDIKINSYMSNEEIMQRINDNFPTQMRVLEVYNPEVKFKELCYIDYDISITSPKVNEALGEQIKSLFTNECKIVKKTKSGEKEINLSEYIKLLLLKCEENTLYIHTILPAGNDMNLNPELLIEAIKQNIGILNTDSPSEHYSIMRKKMLDSDLKEFR